MYARNRSCTCLCECFSASRTRISSTYTSEIWAQPQKKSSHKIKDKKIPSVHFRPHRPPVRGSTCTFILCSFSVCGNVLSDSMPHSRSGDTAQSPLCHSAVSPYLSLSYIQVFPKLSIRQMHPHRRFFSPSTSPSNGSYLRLHGLV